MYPDCASFLIDSGAKTSATIFFDTKNAGREAMIKALLKSPTVSQNINKQDSTGTTALIYAARTGNEALVKDLVSVKGINANLQDNTGMTALMYATSNNNGNISGNLLPLLKLLIKIPGINLNLKNNYKNAPMQCSTNKLNQENPENTVMTGCTALDYIGNSSANNMPTTQNNNEPSYYNDYATFLTKVGAISGV